MVIPSGRGLRSLALWMIFNFDLILKSCSSKFIPIFVTIKFLASSNETYFFKDISNGLFRFMDQSLDSYSDILILELQINRKFQKFAKHPSKMNLLKVFSTTQLKMYFWEDQTVILIHTAVFPKVDSAILT